MHLIFFAILFLYVLLILIYSLGWQKVRRISNKTFYPKVSVVIAIRNEENNIGELISSLDSQIYPSDKLEFILVDDHSNDNTRVLLENSSLFDLKVVRLPQSKSGKKQAIKMGVSIASGEIILSSDADCILNPNWVRTMASYFSDNNLNLVSGPVFFNEEQGFFQNFLALEFASLIGSGAGAIGVKNAIFCNGANLAYRKKIFLELNGLKDDSVASGDDVFLLHSVKAKYPNSIGFAKNKAAVVFTNSVKTCNDFINQRKRWASKSSSYKDIVSIYVSYLVFFTNFLLVFLFLRLIFDSLLLNSFLGFYIIKFFVDSLLLIPVLKFFERTDLIKWIFPFQLFYSFYIVLIVLLSFSSNFQWKGRTHNK